VSISEQIYSYQTTKGAFFGIDCYCRSYRLRLRGFLTQKEALLVLESLRLKILTGTFKLADLKRGSSTTSMSFDRLFKLTLANAGLKQSTVGNRLAQYQAQIEKVFGRRQISSISGREVDAFLTEKLGEISSGYVKALHHLFNFVFKAAYKRNLIETLPEYSSPKVRLKKKKIFLSMEESTALLKYGYAHPATFKPSITHLVHFCILTGCRIGEILALEVSDIDVDNGLISISKRIYKGVIDTPKNDKKGTIPLHPELVAVFKRQVRINQEIRSTKNTDSNRLFLGSYYGTPLSRSQVYLKIKQLAAAVLGTSEGISAHCFRRSLSQHLIQQGLDINSVSGMLRNTSQVMLKSYSQLDLDKLQSDFSSLTLTGSINIQLDGYHGE
jgi:integrase